MANERRIARFDACSTKWGPCESGSGIKENALRVGAMKPNRSSWQATETERHAAMLQIADGSRSDLERSF